MILDRRPKMTTVQIAAGSTRSSPVDGRYDAAYGLVLPSAFTGTSLTFEVSADGSTYQPLYDASNTQVTVTVAPGRSYDLPDALRVWARWVIVSNAAEAEDRTLVVAAKA